MCLAHTHTHTLDTGLVQIWFPTKHWEIEQFSETKHKNTRRILSLKSATHTHTHFGYRMVRIWFPTEGARKIESWAASIRAESQQSPRDSKEDFRKVVHESWRYTRRGVQRYSRRVAAQFQGIPNGVSLDTNSPEGGRGGPGGLESHQTLG